MSELNNELEEEKNAESKEVKNQFVKKYILFLLIFSIVCICITAFLIYQNENGNISVEVQKDENIIKKQKNNKKQVEKCEGLKAKDDTYKLNNLKIIEKSIEDEPKLNIEYFEIDGLKDLELQQKINDRVRNTTMSMYTTEELKDENITSIFITARLEANYGNVLSIDIYKSATCIQSNETYSKEETININLVNGDDITFEELFLKDAPIKNILSQATYESLIKEVPFDEDEVFLSDLSKKDYSQVEDELFLIMQYYNSQDKIKFSFSPNYISVFIREHLININMEEFYDQIAIYTRYKDAENIYDGKYNNSQEILVFTYAPDVLRYTYYNLEKASENLFVKIGIERPEEYSEVFVKELDKCKNSIIERIEEYKNSNDGKARYIRAEINCSTMDWENELEHTIQIQYYEYETSAEYFKTDFYPYILKQLQNAIYLFNDGFIYYDDFDSSMKENINEKVNAIKTLKYNFDTEVFEEVIEE